MARRSTPSNQGVGSGQDSLLPDEHVVEVAPGRSRAGENQVAISTIWHRIVGLMEPGAKTPDMYKVLGRWRQLRGTDRVEEALLAVELRARQGQYENLDHAKRSLMLYMRKSQRASGQHGMNGSNPKTSGKGGPKEDKPWDKRCDKSNLPSQSQETDWDKLKAEWEASKRGSSQ